MMYIIAALAVYKSIHVTTSLLTREVMPWVKVVAGLLFSIGAVGFAGTRFGPTNFSNFVLSSLAVATLAGVTHTVIRLLTFLGDMAARKASR